MSPAQSVGKRVRMRQDWFWFYLLAKVARVFFFFFSEPITKHRNVNPKQLQIS